MNFKLPVLAYDFDALEPWISREIMQLHYHKHHQGYINKLNEIIKSNVHLSICDEKELLMNISDIPKEMQEGIRNYAGGHSNHSLWWEIIEPAENNVLSPKFQRSINVEYMNLQNLKEWIFNVASKHFGSGWVWLVVNRNKKMEIYSTPNQNSPYEKKHIPVLGIDLWEHSYYLQYKNDRGEYLKKVWDILNWEVISRKYEEAIHKIL